MGKFVQLLAYVFTRLRAWHALDPEEERYLVQISPPAGILIDAVRAVVAYQSIPTIAILYSDDFSEYTLNYAIYLLIYC